jgi:hypothetical protein
MLNICQENEKLTIFWCDYVGGGSPDRVAVTLTLI